MDELVKTKCNRRVCNTQEKLDPAACKLRGFQNNGKQFQDPNQRQKPRSAEFQALLRVFRIAPYVVEDSHVKISLTPISFSSSAY